MKIDQRLFENLALLLSAIAALILIRHGVLEKP